MVFPLYPFRPFTQGHDLGHQWSPGITGTRFRIIPESHTHFRIVVEAVRR